MSCYIIYRANLFIHSLLIQSQIFNRLQALCQAQGTLCEQTQTQTDSWGVFTYFWQIYHISGSRHIFPDGTKEDTCFLSHPPPPILTPHCFPPPAPACSPVLNGLGVVISVLSLHQNRQEVLFNPGFWGPSPELDSIGLGWGPRICFSNMFLGEANDENSGLMWWVPASTWERNYSPCPNAISSSISHPLASCRSLWIPKSWGRNRLIWYLAGHRGDCSWDEDFWLASGSNRMWVFLRWDYF